MSTNWLITALKLEIHLSILDEEARDLVSKSICSSLSLYLSSSSFIAKSSLLSWREQ